MKAATVFALRVLVLTLLLVVVFMIASNVAGLAKALPPSIQAASHSTIQAAATQTTSSNPSAQAAAIRAAQMQQAAALLPPLLVYTLLVSLVMAWIIQRSRWRGWKLTAALVFTFYGVMTVTSQVETVVYLRQKMSPRLIESLFVMGGIVAILYVPLAVLIMRKMRQSSDQLHTERALPLANLAARFCVLAIVYVALYYLFGYYVAWQNPELRQYYSGSTELVSFYQTVHAVVTATPWMLPVQFGRGLLWVLFAYPVVKMLNSGRIETAGIIAALFGVGSFVLFIPNPLMPPSIAHSHFWETLGEDLILGAVVGWVLAPSVSPTLSRQTQPAVS